MENRRWEDEFEDTVIRADDSLYEKTNALIEGRIEEEKRGITAAEFLKSSGCSSMLEYMGMTKQEIEAGEKAQKMYKILNSEKAIFNKDLGKNTQKLETLINI